MSSTNLVETYSMKKPGSKYRGKSARNIAMVIWTSWFLCVDLMNLVGYTIYAFMSDNMESITKYFATLYCEIQSFHQKPLRRREPQCPSLSHNVPSNSQFDIVDTCRFCTLTSRVPLTTYHKGERYHVFQGKAFPGIVKRYASSFIINTSQKRENDSVSI